MDSVSRAVSSPTGIGACEARDQCREHACASAEPMKSKISRVCKLDLYCVCADWSAETLVLIDCTSLIHKS